MRWVEMSVPQGKEFVVSVASRREESDSDEFSMTDR